MRQDDSTGDRPGGAASVTGDAARSIEANVGVEGDVGGSGSGPRPDVGTDHPVGREGDAAGGAVSVTGDAARDIAGTVGEGGETGGSGSGQQPAE